jgi:hypothetical protein
VREAGLRWQGLTFAYLVLRRDGITLQSRTRAGALRIVSGLIRTKGKREAHVCGESADGIAMCLDRDESPANQVFSEIRRGDIVAIDPEPAGKGRFRVKTASRIVIDGDTPQS